MNTSLTLRGIDSTEITATPEARRRRDDLLVKARQGDTIADAASATAAAATLTDIKNFTRTVQAGRVEVKAPVLALGKRIDALADELTESLELEATRISKALGAWQTEEKRRADEAKRKAWEEEQRIRREAEERERKAREETERKAREERERAEAEARAAQEKADKERQELEAKAYRARSEAGRVKAQQEADAAAKRAKEEQERLQAERELGEAEAQVQAERESQERADQERQAVIANRTSSVVAVAPKPAGIATRTEICFEVTDISALYEAVPYMVNLSPNNAAIKGALKGMRPDQGLPGIRWWVEQKSIVR